jgi:antiviral helicase SKI2
MFQDPEFPTPLEDENKFGTSDLDLRTEIDELLPTSVSYLFDRDALVAERVNQRTNLNPSASNKHSRKRAKVQKRDWVHIVDINKPMKNFHELVPEMAHKVCEH